MRSVSLPMRAIRSPVRLPPKYSRTGRAGARRWWLQVAADALETSARM